MRWIALALAACAAPAPPAAPRPPSRSRVEYAHHHSEALGVDKTYLVYVPAGYDDSPTTHWPVFYYLHGLTSPETEWIQAGKLDETADQLALAALVVMLLTAICRTLHGSQSNDTLFTKARRPTCESLRNGHVRAGGTATRNRGRHVHCPPGSPRNRFRYS